MLKPRDAVYNIIYKVRYSDKYSNILLNHYLLQNKFTAQEKAFISRLVYETLSRIYFLDTIIKDNSTIGFSKISKKIRVILEMSICELFYFDNAKDFAVVSEAFKLSKKYDKRGSSFVNAILRKISSDYKENPDIVKKYESKMQKVKTKEDIKNYFSVSKFITNRLVDNYGLEFTRDMLLAMNEKPEIFIRGNILKYTKTEFENLMKKEEMNFKLIDEKNLIYSLDKLNSLNENKLFKDGGFFIMDLAAMKSALAVDPKPEEKILDLCAAPGGKSIFMAELAKDKADILSIDISEPKLGLMMKEVEKRKIKSISKIAMDSTKYCEKFENTFDKVLADVPCSGFGILRKKPEIRYKEYEDLTNLYEIQYKILENAGKYVKINGTVVYSTCTLGKEENKDIVDKFLKNYPNFTLEFSKEFYPHIDKTDGFYIAKLKKISK